MLLYRYLIIFFFSTLISCSVTDSPFDFTEPAGTIYTPYYKNSMFNSNGDFFSGVLVYHYFKRPDSNSSGFRYFLSNLLLEYDGSKWHIHNPENVFENISDKGLLYFKQIGDNPILNCYIQYSREGNDFQYFNSEIYKKLNLESFIDLSTTPAQPVVDSALHLLSTSILDHTNRLPKTTSLYYTKEGSSLLQSFPDISPYRIELLLPHQKEALLLEKSSIYYAFQINWFFKFKNYYYASVSYRDLDGEESGKSFYKIDEKGTVNIKKYPNLHLLSDIAFYRDDPWVIAQLTPPSIKETENPDSVNDISAGNNLLLMNLNHPEEKLLLDQNFNSKDIGRQSIQNAQPGTLLGPDGCYYIWGFTSNYWEVEIETQNPADWDLNIKKACISEEEPFTIADENNFKLTHHNFPNLQITYAAVVPQKGESLRVLLTLDSGGGGALKSRSKIVEAVYENKNWKLNVLLSTEY